MLLVCTIDVNITYGMYSCGVLVTILLHKRTGVGACIGVGNSGGGGHEFARLSPKAGASLRGSGGMLLRKILKNRISLI